MNCPTCDGDRATLVIINGEKKSLLDPSQIKRKGVKVHTPDGWAVQVCRAVPVVVVKKAGA